jgi:hypothetical protein
MHAVTSGPSPPLGCTEKLGSIGRAFSGPTALLRRQGAPPAARQSLTAPGSPELLSKPRRVTCHPRHRLALGAGHWPAAQSSCRDAGPPSTGHAIPWSWAKAGARASHGLGSTPELVSPYRKAQPLGGSTGPASAGSFCSACDAGNRSRTSDRPAPRRPQPRPAAG